MFCKKKKRFSNWIKTKTKSSTGRWRRNLKWIPDLFPGFRSIQFSCSLCFLNCCFSSLFCFNQKPEFISRAPEWSEAHAYCPIVVFSNRHDFFFSSSWWRERVKEALNKHDFPYQWILSKLFRIFLSKYTFQATYPLNKHRFIHIFLCVCELCELWRWYFHPN